MLLEILTSDVSEKFEILAFLRERKNISPTFGGVERVGKCFFLKSNANVYIGYQTGIKIICKLPIETENNVLNTSIPLLQTIEKSCNLFWD